MNLILPSFKLGQIWETPGTTLDGGEQHGSMRETILWALVRDFEVWITGHSLGGAVATTVAGFLLCGNNSFKLPCISNLHIVTFNSPRVFKTKSAQEYERSREEHDVKHRKIECMKDIVKLVPLRYDHVGVSEVRNNTILGITLR